ncbi:MAG: flagellar hook-basal body complex protein FliE [Chloroflexi bacterium]|nr:flagellar hook-basal body complex protein FliE [Chloroflexota bacterium]
MGLNSISAITASLKTAAATQAVAPARAAAPGALDSFGQTISHALEGLNSTQLEADSAMQKLAAGESADIAQVMMTAEKANLSMQFAVAVRNKVVESYQEIMRMQV